MKDSLLASYGIFGEKETTEVSRAMRVLEIKKGRCKSNSILFTSNREDVGKA